MINFNVIIDFIRKSNLTELEELNSLYEKYKNDLYESRFSDIEEIYDIPRSQFLNIVRFYNILIKSGMIFKIVGVGKHIDQFDRNIASDLYTVNTRGFMLDFNSGNPDPSFTDEQIENAIDDEFNPYEPLKKWRKTK